MVRRSLEAGGVPRQYWWYILAIPALALALGVELSASSALAGAPIPDNPVGLSIVPGGGPGAGLATSPSSPLTCTLDYIVTSSTGASIDPGSADTGNHTDDGTTAIGLPFAFVFYGSAFTSANVSSNGN